MVVCVNCGINVPTLYHCYSEESCCLELCKKCGHIADKYVEWDMSITAIELFLLRVEVFRHFIFNYDSRTYRGKRVITSNVKRRTIHVVLLFASAVFFDCHRMISSCRFVTQSLDTCIPNARSKEKFALEAAAGYFNEKQDLLPRGVALQDFDDEKLNFMTQDVGEPTQLIENMLRVIRSYYKVMVIETADKFGTCKPLDYGNKNNLLALFLLQDPSLYTFVDSTKPICIKFEEMQILVLALYKLGAYFIFLFVCYLIFGLFKKPNADDYKEKLGLVSRFLTGSMSVLRSILLCIHLKAVIILLITWYPRLTLFVCIELYACVSDIISIHAVCRVNYFIAAVLMVLGWLVKLKVHQLWLFW